METRRIKRKVILIKDNEVYICVDFNRPGFEQTVEVPFYPEIDDAVIIDVDNEDFLAQVKNVFVEDKWCGVLFSSLCLMWRMVMELLVKRTFAIGMISNELPTGFLLETFFKICYNLLYEDLTFAYYFRLWYFTSCARFFSK